MTLSKSWMVHRSSLAALQMMVICEQVTTGSVGKLEPAFCEGGNRAPHVDHRLPGRTCRRRRGDDQQAVFKCATICVTLQGAARFAARPASQSRHPQAGSDGRTNPLRHWRLCTDSPSRAASHTRTARPWDNLCPQPVRGAVAVRYLGAGMC